MKSKKLLSLLLAVLLLCGSVSASFEALAANAASVESVAEAIEELNETEAAEEKTIEESAGSRIILKASHQPDIYGNARCIKGTAGKFILQYATEAEAAEALGYYRSLSFVKWAELDCVNETQAINYGNFMLGSDEAVEYIEEHQIDTSKTIIAVIDSGIDTSSEFFTENERMIDSGVNVSTTGKTDTANDDNGHGTQVSAIVLDNTNSQVEVVAYKAMNKYGEGSDLAIATCMDLAVENGANVINLSLGHEGDTSNIMMESIQNALDHDVTVVVAAGNEGREVKDFSPACLEECITVSAIDKDGNEDFYSNYGEGVDFAAPGHMVMTTYGEYTEEYGEVFGQHTGTSFAAPFVAAAAAMVKSVYPQYTREQIEDTLKNSCVSFANLNYHDGFHKDLEFFLSRSDGDGVCSAGCMKEYADYPTPDNKEGYYGCGMPNFSACILGERTQPVTFSVGSGHYIDKVFNLKLSSEEGSLIYYTTDQSYPSKYNGTLYTGNIVIDGTTSIRAVAYLDGKAPSVPTAREYRMEYHDFNEDNWVITEEGHITEYKGTVTELIVPETIKGITVTRLGTIREKKPSDGAWAPDIIREAMKLPNVKKLTSINLPATYEGGNPKNATYLKFVTSASKVMPPTGADSDSGNIRKFHRDWRNENSGIRVPDLISIDAPNVEVVEKLSGTYIQEAYFPNTKEIKDGAFNCCQCLKRVTLGDEAIIGEKAFLYCFGLRELHANSIKSIGNNGFELCNRLRSIDLSEVTEIGEYGLWEVRQLKGTIELPKATSIGKMSITETITELSLPKTVAVGHYPVLGEDLRLIVSSKMSYCPLASRIIDGSDYDIHDLVENSYLDYMWEYHNKGIDDYKNLKIYAPRGSYAQQFAKDNKYTFIAIPVLETQPENMGYLANSILTTKVVGFYTKMQWYGTSRKDNHGGVVLLGETGETLDTSKYNYRYYYCRVTTSDGEETTTFITGESNLNYYDFNKDKSIDIGDLSMLLLEYGQKAQSSTEIYDIAEDGVIDLADITILLSNEVFGATA